MGGLFWCRDQPGSNGLAKEGTSPFKPPLAISYLRPPELLPLLPLLPELLPELL